MKTKKAKLYIVPHTHWDREWYFTKITGDVLLNHMMNDIFHYGHLSPLMLDGQFSLLDDYLKANPNRKTRFMELLENEQLSCGPFYTQPDLFNSSGETTLRNIEMGQKLAKSLKAPLLKTAYLPDTFGFPSNLPQILKTKGIRNFVFWRGINEKVSQKSAYFKWEGIDGSQVRAYNFKNGYYQLGQYYPYNEMEIKNLNKNAKKFCEKVEQIANQLILNSSNAKLLPLGGDQAPYLYKSNSIINHHSKNSSYKMHIVSNYEQFFAQNNTPKVTHYGQLKIPLTGKIHRTISSTRYDIKYAFRIAENKVYHLLEPLEVFYGQYDPNYDFDSFKEHHIIKPLLIAQAHDSLGGCNTDRTNRRALERLDKIIDATMSQVDLLLKKLLNHFGFANKAIAIFNPSPFSNHLFERKTIYGQNRKIYIQGEDFGIYTLASQNISLVPKKPIYKQDVIIFKDNLKPLQLLTKETGINESSWTQILKSPNKKQNIQIKDQEIAIKIENNQFKISFLAVTNDGDNYDFSPGKKLVLNQKHTFKRAIMLTKTKWFFEFSSKLKIANTSSIVNWNFFMDKQRKTVKTSFEITNKFKDVRLSLQVIKPYKKLAKSQHLVIANFVKNDFIKDWKTKYHEYPVHVDHNDGLIQMDDLNIMTNGTNEFYKLSNGIEIILYRTNGFVTKSNMKYRTTTSGLSFKWNAFDSQLQKKLAFSFEFTYNSGPMQALNSWKFKPYFYKVQSQNFIANKMSKFVLNDIIKNELKHFKIAISDREIFISAFYRCQKALMLRLVNMVNKPKQIQLKVNNQSLNLNFNNYEIKEKRIEGVF